MTMHPKNADGTSDELPRSMSTKCEIGSKYSKPARNSENKYFFDASVINKSVNMLFPSPSAGLKTILNVIVIW